LTQNAEKGAKQASHITQGRRAILTSVKAEASMQETFVKSSLYATCAGHKLRPARQVYSGFQNKIKTICIHDTPLSVSSFS